MVDVYYIKIAKQIFNPWKVGDWWVFVALRYGQDTFIDDVSTMKGGIVYPYYWYIFTAVVYKDPSYADGLVKAYVEENKMIDILDPTTGRREYAMWTFCNNHDNWRLQSMVNSQALRMCLAVITFWLESQSF